MQTTVQEIILVIDSFNDDTILQLLQPIPNKNKYTFIFNQLPKHLLKGISQLTDMKISEVSHDTLFQPECIYYLNQNEDLHDFINKITKDSSYHLNLIVCQNKLNQNKINKEKITVFLDKSLNDMNNDMDVDYCLSKEEIPILLNIKEQLVTKQIKKLFKKIHKKYHLNFDELKMINNEFNQIELDVYQQIEKLSFIAEHVSSMVLTTNEEGIIEYVNARYLNMTGYNRQEVIGKKIKKFVTDENILNNFEAIFSDIKKGIMYNNQLYSTKKDGNKYYENFTMMPILDYHKNLKNIIIISEDITEKKANEDFIKELAFKDPLTHLVNRLYFKEKANTYITNNDNKQKMAILMMDLNAFKDVNDSLGHNIGDILLQEVVKRINLLLKKENILSRFGGDEFTLLMPNIIDDDEVISMSKKINDLIRKPFKIDGHTIHSSLSIGIVIYPEHGVTLDELLKYAEIAMYTAKKNHSDYALFSDSMRYSILDRLEIENSIHQAILNKEFTLHYQPIIDIKTGQLTSIETLLRWHSKEKGILAPNYFLDFIEKSGQIIQIGEHTMMDALSKFELLKEDLPDHFEISFNLSTKQLLYEALVDNFMHMMAKTNFNPRNLMIEITESITAEDIKNTTPIFKHLSNLGVSFSMDDFGTGYSSLGQLKNYPINKVKIDKLFIDKMEEDNDYQSILKGIIALAHTMNYKVVAEGVETESQLALLKEYDCDEVQGYFFCKPIPFEELKEILKNNKGNFYHKNRE